MERGFKSRCEEMARSLRRELGLGHVDPLDADQLAGYLDVSVWSVSEIGLSDHDLRQLVEVDADSWSAITVAAFGREAIIVNPVHSRGRYSSDVMHELAHLILGHDPSTVFFVGEGEIALRGYNSVAEEEASWLAAVLLLPREALMHIRRRRIPDRESTELYGVSKRLLTFRMNVTAVDRQFKSRKMPAAQRR